MKDIEEEGVGVGIPSAAHCSSYEFNYRIYFLSFFFQSILFLFQKLLPYFSLYFFPSSVPASIKPLNPHFLHPLPLYQTHCLWRS